MRQVIQFLENSHTASYSKSSDTQFFCTHPPTSIAMESRLLPLQTIDIFGWMLRIVLYVYWTVRCKTIMIKFNRLYNHEPNS